MIDSDGYRSNVGIILRENLPSGWTLVDSFPPVSSVDADKQVARWIFRNPQAVTDVFYLLQVPADLGALEQSADISGEVIANPDGQRTVVSLHSGAAMTLAPIHWADRNANHVIDDMEILDLSDLSDRTGPLDFGWEEIEDLWEAGAYHWNAQERRFVAGRDPDSVQN